MTAIINRIWVIFKARTKEFYRDRSSLGWNFFFPFFIIVGFSFMFDQNSQKLYKVGIHKSSHQTSIEKKSFYKRYELFKMIRYIEIVQFKSKQKAIKSLNHHRIDFLLDLDKQTYHINKTSPKGYIVEKLFLSSSMKASDTEFTKKTISRKEIPYIEWLFPGILGMNIMFSSIFGVGYVIVRYRKNGALKRLSVTPLHTFEFLTAQVFSRIFVIIATTIIVYAGCSIIYNFQCRGSYLTLFLAYALGGFSMVSIGLLVSSRSSSEEFAGGILNLITWPMMFLSEVWFSLEGASPWVKYLSKIFPLTHIIGSARKIMNDGATLYEVRYELLLLLFMSIVFITISSLLFKWHRDA